MKEYHMKYRKLKDLIDELDFGFGDHETSAYWFDPKDLRALHLNTVEEMNEAIKPYGYKVKYIPGGWITTTHTWVFLKIDDDYPYESFI